MRARRTSPLSATPNRSLSGDPLRVSDSGGADRDFREPSTQHEIYLRCHTRLLEGKASKARPFPKHVLVLDTETTTDSLQSLNFGVYQFCESGLRWQLTQLAEEGLFHADDLDAAPVGSAA